MKHRDLLELTAARTVDDFQSRLVQAAHRLDFGLVSAALAVEHADGAASFRMVGNTPQAFVDASRDLAGARRDPVMQRLRRLSIPFAYDRDLYAAAGADDLWEAQAPHGYRTGVAVALHLEAGRHFLLGLDRHDALPRHEAQLMRLLADLQLLAVYAQDAAVRLLANGAASTLPHLTAREREVLLWTSEGKTAAETAMLLGVSTHAVNFHVRNAAEKLGAPNKHAAVARAVTLGLLKRR